MLDIVSKGFKSALNKFKGKVNITSDNIKDAVIDIKNSLLEADVEYDIVTNFIENITKKSIGKIVQIKAGKGGERKKINPGDHFINICQKELETLMGPEDSSLNLNSKGLSKIMLVGLQGSGKTTTAAKLANYLNKKNKKILLVAADIYRPAAVEQLMILGEKLSIPVFHQKGLSATEICKAAEQKAYKSSYDTLIIDTAGRLTIDEKLMEELKDVKTNLNPENILFVCDAMMGQDAVTTAKSFNDLLDISGSIITKLDGDTRGGAALSIRQISSKPLKFIGMGEKLEDLEEFRPQGLASRILGMGDVVGLVKDFEKVITKEDEEKKSKEILKGKFNYKSYYDQLKTINKLGDLRGIADKLPIGNMFPDANLDNLDSNEFKNQVIIIDSMTYKEKMLIDPIDESRKSRIAKGSGKSISDINNLIEKFNEFKLLMKKFKRFGMFDKLKDMTDLSQIGNFAKNVLNKPTEIRNSIYNKKRKAKQMAKKARKKSRRK